ncbi:hypothetical protein [Methylobacterium radiodurans]|uniref:Uncharacterized protein n=1 Tax=Methylobacterium radiodurans TaxID=2202828 RepID=A0A2U8VLX0_9HYPH|nr:hypothetical protein [Methylobacterium radiodurans]AWN34402.1 hypothetical protein DK427_00450 [Methylobacterium radiodurans]
MSDVTTDRVDARTASVRTPSQSFAAPPPDTEDPARQVGEIFRRLSGCQSTYGETAFARIVAAVLVALGRAAMEESELQARRLRERTASAGPGIKVSATARRVDFDGWDPGERD